VVALLDSTVDRGAPIAANRLLAALRSFFNWCCERGLLTVSPCDRLKAPSPERSRDRVLSDRELAQIWQAAGRLGYPFGPAYQLLALTAQRRTEVCGMRWDELDPDLTLWSLPAARVKNNTAHQVPIATPARAILASLPRIVRCPFVFSSNGRTPVSGHSRPKRALDAMVPEVGPWRLHDLRRSAATGMARRGVQLPVIEKILNHTGGSFAGVVGTYQRHDFADEKRAALELWAQFVVGLQS
jgi:integrase